jgi:hypothetical protein
VCVCVCVCVYLCVCTPAARAQPRPTRTQACVCVCVYLCACTPASRAQLGPTRTQDHASPAALPSTSPRCGTRRACCVSICTFVLVKQVKCVPEVYGAPAVLVLRLPRNQRQTLHCICAPNRCVSLLVLLYQSSKQSEHTYLTPPPLPTHTPALTSGEGWLTSFNSSITRRSASATSLHRSICKSSAECRNTVATHSRSARATHAASAPAVSVFLYSYSAQALRSQLGTHLQQVK